MTAAAASASIVFLAGSVLLLVAGVGHVRHHHAFAETLASHRLLPGRLIRPVSWGVVAAELVAGSWGALAVVDWQGDGDLWVAAASAQPALYLLFLAYLVALLRLRPGADCGCFNESRPVNGATVVRAAGVAAAALAFPVLASWATTGLPLTGAQMAVSCLCAAGLVAVLSVLPQAMAGVPASRSQ